jgi:hypothetical protein
MGTLTEFFWYLETDPKFIRDTIKTFSHFTPYKKHIKIRRKLKLYKKNDSI